MEQLGYSEKELKTLKAFDTAKEIGQQPHLWIKIWKEVFKQRSEIAEFLNHATSFSDSIILTGAGTSAFIGLSLKAVFDQKFGLLTEAISTTDLVSHPQNYLSEKRSVLLVSFARSGDSPESMAVVDLADKHSRNCFHFVITCNPNGKLVNGKTKNGKYVFLLPEEANDKSLAMTSSYTGMILSGILIARIKEIESLKDQVAIVSRCGEQILTQSSFIKKIAALNFKRAVFLGSGPLAGTAQESHLKVQELTDGIVICKHDSYLGFRHGPKAVINNDTLVVYLFSNQEYVLKYEKDLVNAMIKGNKVMYELGVMEASVDVELENKITFETKSTVIQEEFLAVCCILPAQLLGFYKSINLGLSPDNPSISGAISRVVEGVKIYGK